MFLICASELEMLTLTPDRNSGSARRKFAEDSEHPVVSSRMTLVVALPLPRTPWHT